MSGEKTAEVRWAQARSCKAVSLLFCLSRALFGANRSLLVVGVIWVSFRPSLNHLSIFLNIWCKFKGLSRKVFSKNVLALVTAKNHWIIFPALLRWRTREVISVVCKNTIPCLQVQWLVVILCMKAVMENEFVLYFHSCNVKDGPFKD